jgi:hypothetical protein
MRGAAGTRGNGKIRGGLFRTTRERRASSQLISVSRQSESGGRSVRGLHRLQQQPPQQQPQGPERRAMGLKSSSRAHRFSTGGGGTKDVEQWIHRYERIGRYNRRGDDELSLTGAALKWFMCKDAAGQLATERQDDAGPPMVE